MGASVMKLTPKDGDGDDGFTESATLNIETVSNGWILKYETDDDESVEVFGFNDPAALLESIKEALNV